MLRTLSVTLMTMVAALLASGCATRYSMPTGVQQDEVGRYTVSAVPKVEGRYLRVNNDMVRILPFEVYRIAGEDEANFYVKQYEPVAQPLPAQFKSPIRMAPPLPKSSKLAFDEAGEGLPRNGQWRESFAIADMNGDGRPDLVFAPARKTLTAPVIFLNDGGRRFRRWTTATFPSLPYDYGAVAVADFNGDGHADIAIAEHLVGVGVLLGDGRGNFRAFNDGLPAMKAGERSDTSFTSKAIRAVDWDGDGRVDLVVQQEAGGGRTLTTRPDNLVVFLNRGDRWQVLDAGSGERIPGDRIAIADLDGDGKPDAVLASAMQGDKRLGRLNRGNAIEAVDFPGLPDGTSVETVAAGDVDGDGKPDVIVAMVGWTGAFWISGIDVMVNDGGRYVQKSLWREASRDSVSAIAVADVDGDGRPDIVALRQNGELLSFLSDGRGWFTQDATMAVPAWRIGCGGADLQPITIDGTRMLVAAFSGEPSAYQIPPRCRNEGGVTLIAVTAR